MGTAERRELEKRNIRKKIIDAANDILGKEGYENLSIRKIANKIDYSPGIIYFYFKDKSEIVNSVVEEGYGKILKTISKVPVDVENPEKTIVNSLRAYIELMLEAPEQFKAILMSDIQTSEENVNILKEGISKERNTIQGICKVLKIGIEKGKFRNLDTELTAQIIWTSTYGLVSRLILEKNISKKQRERLINQHFEVVINGILI